MALASRLALLALCLCGGCQTPSADSGIVVASSARNHGGQPVFWSAREVTLQPLTPNAAIGGEDLQRALLRGAGTWNRATNGCGPPKLKVAPHARVARGVRQDGISTVVVRADSWCPDDVEDEGGCYAAERLAITHLYPNEEPGSAEDGLVREADIEINAVQYRWSLEGSEAGTVSLSMALAHELGHVLGLGHSCESSEAGAAGRERAPCDRAGRANALMVANLLEIPRDRVAPHPGELRQLCAGYGARRRDDAASP